MISLLAFMMFGVYEVSKFGITSTADLVAISLRGIAAAAIVLGLSRTILPILAVLSGPAKKMQGGLSHARHESERKRFQAEQAQRERQQQAEWERLAPVREREQQERRLAEEQNVIEQRQREQIRLECQLLYDRHAERLQDHFPRSQYLEYFQQYLMDDLPVEIIVQRGSLLKELIESSLEETETDTHRFSSVADIAQYFQHQRQEVQRLPYDEATRQTFLASLNQQESRTVREFLSS